MIHPETTKAWKAGLLFGLGAVCGLIGMLLRLGLSAAGRSVAEPDSPLAGFLVRAPTILLAAGCILAAGAALVLCLEWFHKQP